MSSGDLAAILVSIGLLSIPDRLHQRVGALFAGTAALIIVWLVGYLGGFDSLTTVGAFGSGAASLVTAVATSYLLWQECGRSLVSTTPTYVHVN